MSLQQVSIVAEKPSNGKTRTRIIVDTDDEAKYILKLNAVKLGKTISEIVTEIIKKEFREDALEYRKNPPKTVKDPRGRKKKKREDDQ